MESKFIICSFYTPDYSDFADKFIKSLNEFGIQYDVRKIDSKGSWSSNCYYKPVFIKEMLEKYKPKPVIWNDCDAIICQYPKIFDIINCDFAARYVDEYAKFPKEFIAGTLYFGNTIKCVEFVDLWISLCFSLPRQRSDQNVLQKAISKWDGEVVALPREYAMFFDRITKQDCPIILHDLASRTKKKLINDNVEKNTFCNIKKNQYLGQRCFIIGSGSSIKNQNLNFLKNEITIGSNQSYLLGEQYGFDLTYMCLSDFGLYPKIRSIYEKLKSRIVLTSGENNKNGRNYQSDNLSVLVNLICDQTIYDGYFSFDLTNHVYKSWNVMTDIVLPLAMFLGFSEIYLLGCDLDNRGYFFDKEMDIDCGKIRHYHPGLEKAYEIIYGHCKKLDISVFNLSPTSAIQCIPKMRLEDLSKKSTLILPQRTTRTN